MQAAEFIRRFNLHVLPEPEIRLQLSGRVKQASVLIPLIAQEHGLEVVLTKRASHLKHHPGQISFPGGRVEPDDPNLIFTALRETEEEIGLASQHVNVIGQLNNINTISGYNVTPVVGFIPDNIEFILDENEVEDIFSVPLAHFLNQENHQTVVVHREKHSYPVYFMPYENYNIWGATAAILKDLAEHIQK